MSPTPSPPTPVRRPSRRLGLAAVALALVAALVAAACGDDTSSSDAATTTAAHADIAKNTGPVTVRVGYFPNLTHAPALVAVQQGLFKKELGKNTLETKTFNAGPEAVEAIFGDALDIAYVGPNPAINAWAKSKSDGGAIRIVAGSTSGGAALVVKPEITKAADLKGTTIATPQLGGTQDVAARAWLKKQGLATDTSGGGDVSIKPQANADTLTAFKAGQIDGAWVPEPWASRLVIEGKGKVLVDEKTLWPGGKFITTNIIVRTAFLTAHPDVVADVLRGHLDALDAIAKDPATAKKDTNAAIAAITGKPLADDVIDAAWTNLEFGADPLATTLAAAAASATAAGLLDKVDLQGIYDVDILNQLLTKAGKPGVSA